MDTLLGLVITCILNTLFAGLVYSLLSAYCMLLQKREGRRGGGGKLTDRYSRNQQDQVFMGLMEKPTDGSLNSHRGMLNEDTAPPLHARLVAETL